MYQSNSFSDLLGSSDSYHAKLEFGSNVIDEQIITINLTHRLTSEDAFSFGGSISALCEVTIKQVSFDIEGHYFNLYFSISDSEWIKMGRFKARHPKTENGISTFEAYDVVYSNMNYAYISNLTYPVDCKKILEEISTKTGVTIITSNLPNGVTLSKRLVAAGESVDSDGNPSDVSKYVNPFDGYLLNEALGYIAQLYGMTALANRNGEVEFRSFKPTTFTVGSDLYYDNLSIGEYEFSVEKISCSIGEGKVLYAGSGVESFVFENKYMTQDRLNAIYDSVKTLRYYPTTLRMIGELRLEVGDVIHFRDKSNNDYILPVMYINHKYDGGIITEICSYDRADRESSEGGVVYKGPLSQSIDRQEEEIELIKGILEDKASIELFRMLNLKINELQDMVDKLKTELPGSGSGGGTSGEVDPFNFNGSTFKIWNGTYNFEWTNEDKKDIVWGPTLTLSYYRRTKHILLSESIEGNDNGQITVISKITCNNPDFMVSLMFVDDEAYDWDEANYGFEPNASYANVGEFILYTDVPNNKNKFCISAWFNGSDDERIGQSCEVKIDYLYVYKGHLQNLDQIQKQIGNNSSNIGTVNKNLVDVNKNINDINNSIYIDDESSTGTYTVHSSDFDLNFKTEGEGSNIYKSAYAQYKCGIHGFTDAKFTNVPSNLQDKISIGNYYGSVQLEYDNGNTWAYISIDKSYDFNGFEIEIETSEDFDLNTLFGGFTLTYEGYGRKPVNDALSGLMDELRNKGVID